MKYSFNTWTYGSFPTWLPSYPLDEVIRRLAAIGYDGIEIGCAAPHAWPDYLSSSRRQELRQLLLREGLAVSSLLPAPGGGPGCNPASPLEEERDFTVKHYKDVIDLAADLEAPLVLYVAGWQVFGTSREQAWRFSRDCLAEIGGHAAQRGVTIAVEPTAADSNLIESADHALELRDAVGLDSVRVMFDTFHARYRSEVPADYVRQMADQLVHVHFADHDRLAPQDSDTDWKGVMQALIDHRYDGFITMETGFAARTTDPDANARQALSYLKGIEDTLSR